MSARKNSLQIHVLQVLMMLLKLTPPRVLSLEQCLEFIDNDELLEITPEHLRIRQENIRPSHEKKSFKKQLIIQKEFKYDY